MAYANSRPNSPTNQWANANSIGIKIKRYFWCDGTPNTTNLYKIIRDVVISRLTNLYSLQFLTPPIKWTNSAMYTVSKTMDDLHSYISTIHISDQPFKVLISGDRHWVNRERMTCLFLLLPTNSVIIHGCCRGADMMAESVALELNRKYNSKFTFQRFPADWTQGLKAGPLRNIEMVNENPHLVLAFHNDIKNSKGTKNLVSVAVKKKCVVILVSDGEIRLVGDVWGFFIWSLELSILKIFIWTRCSCFIFWRVSHISYFTTHIYELNISRSCGSCESCESCEIQ